MKKIYLTTFLIVLLIVVLNLVASEFHIRLDLTEGGQYTLSDATTKILGDLEEPVTVKAYFSENLPQQVAKTRRDFQELLVEYANRSDGQLQYEFIDPASSESVETEATQNGIQPLLINVREKDQMKQQKAFLGAVITIGDKKEVIPYLQPGTAMEYALSTSIKKLSISEKPSVGFLTGHGEASLDEMQQLHAGLDILYNPISVSLTDSTGIPENVNTLVMVRPMEELSTQHLAKLDEFLGRGGRLAIAMNRVNGDLQNATGSEIKSGMEAWLEAKGLKVDPNFVIDAKCANITLQQQTPFGVMQSQMPFPYLPIAAKFADHPVTKGLENVIFQFVSTVYYVGDTTKRFTPLVFTSDRSGFQQAPVSFDINKQWTQNDFPMANLVLAGALEGKLSGGAESRIILIADGDFPVNGSGQQAQRLSPDNVNLLSNAIDWLTDDTGLIDLRTKGVTSRPIDEMEDSTRTIVKYATFLSPLMLVLIYGIVRFQRNRVRRLKRMSENYEEDK